MHLKGALFKNISVLTTDPGNDFSLAKGHCTSENKGTETRQPSCIALIGTGWKRRMKGGKREKIHKLDLI